MPARGLLAPAAGLLLLAAVFLWWREPAGDGSNDLAEALLAQDFDYYLTDMQLDRFVPDGTLQYHLAAARVTHYPDPDHSRLEDPVLDWFDPGRPAWALTARHGDLREGPDGQTRLQLRDDVVARRASDGDATLTLRSPSMLILPDSGEARTQDQVTIEDAGTRLTSAGMQAWLREERVRLAAGSGVHE